jgi:hypothetical protein
MEKRTFQNQEEEKGKGRLAALNKMVTIPGELKMDHLKFSIISESGKKMEK